VDCWNAMMNYSGLVVVVDINGWERTAQGLLIEDTVAGRYVSPAAPAICRSDNDGW
jgi:hypothetical protein